MTKSKFHLSVGHDTVMCSVTFFGTNESPQFSLDKEYHYLDELMGAKSGGDDGAERYDHQFVLLEFDSKVQTT